MKKKKLLRLIATIVLGVAAVGCFVVAGVKTSNCIKYSKETNYCTETINQTMFDNPDDFYKPGTEAYNTIESLKAEREEANTKYSKWENGLVGFSIGGFLSTFALVYFLVDIIRRPN